MPRLTAVASPPSPPCSRDGRAWSAAAIGAGPAGCLHMSNQCMTSGRDICIHKWSGVILAGPWDDLSYQLPGRRFSCLLPASWMMLSTSLAHSLSLSLASQVPLDCRRKSVGAWWSRRRQQKLPRRYHATSTMLIVYRYATLLLGGRIMHCTASFRLSVSLSRDC